MESANNTNKAKALAKKAKGRGIILVVAKAIRALVGGAAKSVTKPASVQ